MRSLGNSPEEAVFDHFRNIFDMGSTHWPAKRKSVRKTPYYDSPMGENFKQLFEEKWSVVVVTPPSNYHVALILLVEVPVDPVGS